MRRISTAVALLATGVALWAVSSGPPSAGVVSADDDGKKVVMRDDCGDPATWAAIGGCTLEDGDVNLAEFQGELNPVPVMSLSVIGHQAWRNDPSYLKIEEGDTVKVRNKGGRGHTFTEVARFGGGRALDPRLNQGLTPAPECQNPVTSPIVPPGGRTEVTGLSVGNYRFQCCLHPWMRMLIKVEPEDGDEEDEDIDN